MADRFNFFFRQVVQENEMDDMSSALETADQDAVADLEFGQQATDVGISAYDLTFNPALTADNKEALLGGIHNGLTCSLAPVPSVGAPHTNLKITVKAGTAHDCRGRRLVVGYKHDVSTGRLVLANPTYIVDCAAAGLTPVGEGGSTTGGAPTTPTSGQTRWITLGIQYDRLLLNPRVDGNAATVFYHMVESFRFSVKAGASSATIPAPPPPDPDVIILGDFLLNSSGQIIDQDFKRRGDWIRTTIGAIGDPLLITTENGSDPSHFVERNVRKAILRILRQTGSVSGDLAGHTNQSSPTLRHHAKNIDFSVVDILWANDKTFPDFTADSRGITNPIVGGGTDNDGLQYALHNIVKCLGSASGLVGFDDGAGYIGLAPIDTGSPFFVSPIEWNGGTVGSLMATMLNALNATGRIQGLNPWTGVNLFSQPTFFTADTTATNDPQTNFNIGSPTLDQKGIAQSFGFSGQQAANISVERSLTGQGSGISICSNCFWDNSIARWVANDTTLPAMRMGITPNGVYLYSRTNTTVNWLDDETAPNGWDKKIQFVFVGAGTTKRFMLIGPDTGNGPNILVNGIQSMRIAWEGFHPAGALGTIGGVLNYRFTYGGVPPSSVTAASSAATESNISLAPVFTQINTDSAYWVATPVVPGAYTKLHRIVAIVP